MIKLLLWTAGAMLAGSQLFAADSETAEKKSVSEDAPPSVEKQIDEAVADFRKRYGECMKRVVAEKDEKKRMEIYNQRPRTAKAIAIILQLAQKNPKAKGVDRGLEFSFHTATTEQRQQIIDLMLTHHKNSLHLGQIAKSIGRLTEGGEDWLRQIIEKTENERIRQGAKYVLGSKLTKNPKTKAEGIAVLKKLLATPGIEKNNARLVAQLKGELMVAEKLSIGCTAPDIVGTDHEGKEFKLSDYRGQVVLLDFWGIW